MAEGNAWAAVEASDELIRQQAAEIEALKAEIERWKVIDANRDAEQKMADDEIDALKTQIANIDTNWQMTENALVTALQERKELLDRALAAEAECHALHVRLAHKANEEAMATSAYSAATPTPEAP